MSPNCWRMRSAVTDYVPMPNAHQWSTGQTWLNASATQLQSLFFTHEIVLCSYHGSDGTVTHVVLLLETETLVTNESNYRTGIRCFLILLYFCTIWMHTDCLSFHGFVLNKFEPILGFISSRHDNKRSDIKCICFHGIKQQKDTWKCQQDTQIDKVYVAKQ